MYIRLSTIFIILACFQSTRYIFDIFYAKEDCRSIEDIIKLMIENGANVVEAFHLFKIDKSIDFEDLDDECANIRVRGALIKDPKFEKKLERDLRFKCWRL